MRSKKWKGSKSVLPLLLSAMMVVEPFGMAITVHAEEIAPSTITEELEQEESVNTEENLPDSEEEVKEGADNEAETDDEQDDNSQETNQSPEGETTGEDESLDSEKTDEKDESSEELSDAEDQETDENIPSEEDGVSETELEEETVSGNNMEEEEQDSDTEQFTDMPDKYQLTVAQRIDKEVLAGEVGNINEADEGVLYAKGQVMVAANSREEAEMIAEAYNAEIKGFENGVLLLELQEGSTVASAVKAAASTRNRLPAVWPNYYRYPHVEEAASVNSSDTIKIEETEYEVEDSAATAYAEEDTPTLEAYANAIASYNDPDLLSDSEQYQWQHVAVGSPYAWAEKYTGEGVKVAILDTGVMGTHSELTLAGEADATGTSVVTGSGTASDKGGHGTHVAGIIGAKADNKAGGAGIAPDAALYAVNVLGGDGENAGTDWAIIQGIEQAIKWDVDIINMSLGGPGYSELCQRAVTKAYSNGIAIFVSAGNDGASCINYPAHFDHIICVAATDQNNSRADFSTYGSWVDLSAPGVAIWSTYYDGGYTIMDGTSMACPVAAGEAAVILSGDKSLKAMDKNGSKVDALEKIMKSNAVKVSGSGMGAGVTSLTKVFKLTTASVKPQAPEISIKRDSKAQQVTVTIAATQSGMTIYYTDNGKNPVYKNGAADANTKLYTQPFVIKDKTKGTIKAITVNDSGVASAVKSDNYTLSPYVSDITISGVQQVAKGKSIQLTAEVLPEYATNKKLEWKLYTKDGAEATAAKDNISISSSGKITAKSGAEENAQYTVRATAKDGSGKYDEYAITVIANTKMKSAKFDQKSVTLSIPKEQSHDLASIFKAEFADGTSATVTDFKWSSNNKKVATVDSNGVVWPLKAGKVTITALANDSSGKKATCTVTIKQQATDIQIFGSSSVAAGKGVTFKATISPADVSVKKVEWSIVDYATGEEPAASKGVKINKSNGKLTTKATSAGKYIVKASATDDSGKTSELPITICDGAIKSISFDKPADKKVTIFRRKVTDETKTSATVQVKIEGTTSNANLDAYEVSNSNQGIATVTYSRSGNVITLNISATERAAGKTNITIASTDGTGKKVTCAVTVNNPVTKVHISSATKTMSARLDSQNVIDMMVIKGKSLQLKATLESEYGAISNKKVKWSINAPASTGISINSSGKVTAKKGVAERIYTVTAEAADGSGAMATYNVYPAPAATYVRVPDLIPKPGYVNALNPMPLLSDGTQDILPLPIDTDVFGGYIEATSSNPKAMEVTVCYRGGQYWLLITANRVTKDTMVTVTVKATDGSGKKASYKILVTNRSL